MQINVTAPQLAGVITGTTAAATGSGFAILNNETHKTLTAICIGVVSCGLVLATCLINRIMLNADASQRVQDLETLNDQRAQEATEYMGIHFRRMARDLHNHGTGQEAILKLVRQELDALRYLASGYYDGSDGGARQNGKPGGDSGPNPILRLAE